MPPKKGNARKERNGSGSEIKLASLDTPKPYQPVKVDGSAYHRPSKNPLEYQRLSRAAVIKEDMRRLGCGALR